MYNYYYMSVIIKLRHNSILTIQNSILKQIDTTAIKKYLDDLSKVLIQQ